MHSAERFLGREVRQHVPRYPTLLGIVVAAEPDISPHCFRLRLNPAVVLEGWGQSGTVAPDWRCSVTIAPDSLQVAEDGTWWTFGDGYNKFAISLSPPDAARKVYPWPLELWPARDTQSWGCALQPDSEIGFSMTPAGPVRTTVAPDVRATCCSEGVRIVVGHADSSILRPGERLDLGSWELKVALAAGVGSVHPCVQHVVRRYPIVGLAIPTPRQSF